MISICITFSPLQERMFVVEAAISIWDIAAITVIVREAGGGEVTDIQGQPVTKETASLIATNGVLHSSVLNYFNTA